jgi:hypothetical protein
MVKKSYFTLVIIMILTACGPKLTTPTVSLETPYPTALDMTGQDNFQAKISQANGGIISDRDGFSIQIAPGALSQNGEIQIYKQSTTRINDNDYQRQIGPIYQISLKEADLSDSIYLTLPYKGFDLPVEVLEDNYSVAFFDENIQEWVVLPGVIDPQAKTISTRVDHFSIFGIIAWLKDKPPRILDFKFSPATLYVDCDRIRDPQYLTNLTDNLQLIVDDPDGYEDLDSDPELTLQYEKLFRKDDFENYQMVNDSPGNYEFTWTGGVKWNPVGELFGMCGNLHTIKATVRVEDRPGRHSEATAIQDVQYTIGPQIELKSPIQETSTTTTPVFNWNIAWPEEGQTNFESLEFAISTTPTFGWATVYSERNLPLDQKSISLKEGILKPGKTYYWQVNAVRDLNGPSDWAYVRSPTGRFWVTKGQDACATSDETGCIRVRVKNSQGGPAEDKQVTFYEYENSHIVDRGRTDANGTVYVSGAVGKEYYATVSHSRGSEDATWYGLLCRFTPVANQVTDFTVNLEKGDETTICEPIVEKAPSPEGGYCAWKNNIIGTWVLDKSYIKYNPDGTGTKYPDGDRNLGKGFVWTCFEETGEFIDYTNGERFPIVFQDINNYLMNGTSWSRTKMDITCPRPDEGGAILYQHADYDCGGEGENFGWMIRRDPGFQAVADSFNDRLSSIGIPPGWSVMLYEHDMNAGGYKCLNGSNPFFPNETLNNGVTLNDQVSTFEVFDAPDCGGLPLIRPDYYRRSDYIEEYWNNSTMVSICLYIDRYRFYKMIDDRTAEISMDREVNPEKGDCSQLEGGKTYHVNIMTGRGVDEESQNQFEGRNYPFSETTNASWNDTTFPTFTTMQEYRSDGGEGLEWRIGYKRYYDLATGFNVFTEFAGSLFSTKSGEIDRSGCLAGKMIYFETTEPLQNKSGEIAQVKWPLDLGKTCGKLPAFSGAPSVPVLVAPEKDKKYCKPGMYDLPGDIILEWTGNVVPENQARFSIPGQYESVEPEFDHMNLLELWGRSFDSSDWTLIGRTNLFTYTDVNHQGARLRKDTVKKFMALFESPIVYFKWRVKFVNPSFEIRTSVSDWGSFVVETYFNDDSTCGGTADPNPQSTSINPPIMDPDDFSGGLLP